MKFYSPLRYPGGKRKLVEYVKEIVDLNDLYDGEYAEPFAGGAGVALALLYEMYVSRIHINDLDPAIHNFWHCCLDHPEEFSKAIVQEPISMERWHHHREVLNDKSAGSVEKALALFFLNRTNRSGIITGGVIGGRNQNGKWKLDARFNKADLISRIAKIARHKANITLTNKDASKFLTENVSVLSNKSLVYLDPPYYVKGGELYTHNFNHRNHVDLAKIAGKMKHLWMISYDNVPQIADLYKRYRSLEYGISYTAQRKYVGKELMVFSPALKIPDVSDPTTVKRRKQARQTSF